MENLDSLINKSLHTIQDIKKEHRQYWIPSIYDIKKRLGYETETLYKKISALEKILSTIQKTTQEEGKEIKREIEQLKIYGNYKYNPYTNPVSFTFSVAATIRLYTYLSRTEKYLYKVKHKNDYENAVLSRFSVSV